MTYYDAYIGHPRKVVGLIEEPSSSPDANVGRSPQFPDGHIAYFAVRNGVQSGRMQGIQVDWGSWAALMPRDRIVELLTEIYGPAGEYELQHDDGLKHLADQMRSLRVFVASLPPDQPFAVVVEEF